MPTTGVMGPPPRAAMGWSPTTASTCTKWSRPVSASRRWRSRAAPASSLATASPVASTGDPCGIVIEAEMTSVSRAGTKRKPGRPESTRPTVTIMTPTPTEAVR